MEPPRCEDEIEQLAPATSLPARPIARRLGRPLSTVGLALRRRGLGRLAASIGNRRSFATNANKPGELIHIDIKKLGRIDGIGHRITGDRSGQNNRRSVGRGRPGVSSMWPSMMPSRLAYTELLPDERNDSAVDLHPPAPVDWFARHGLTLSSAS